VNLTYEPEKLRAVAPALERYTRERLMGEVWNRAALDRRDRCLISIAALIARGQAVELGFYANEALENGVLPAEISEVVVHLAYYSGWGNAMAAVAPIGAVFAQRGVSTDQLPDATPALLPLNEASEAQRAKHVGDQFGTIVPGLLDYTTGYLFRDLWLRPALAPRDRSLVTVAALVASGQVAQVTFHLNRAMDNGLTQAQAAEVVTHLAFYAGWPNAMSALPVFKDVFASRGSKRASSIASFKDQPK
jgi:4-carboxymuconolactone decarboxylase